MHIVNILSVRVSQVCNISHVVCPLADVWNEEKKKETESIGRVFRTIETHTGRFLCVAVVILLYSHIAHN